MLNENERFKLISENFPKIGNRILELWGKPGLIAYINKVIDDARKDPTLGLATKIELALYGLRKEHDQLYGRQPATMEELSLADNEHLKTINAQHGRIGRKIAKLWGGPALCEFINTLLQDTRGGTRKGFPPDVAKALFMLMQKHDQEFPEHALKVRDIWPGGKVP
jgi:hypothetical protein